MLINIADIAPLHHAVVLDSIAIVDAVDASDLARPTPCADWTLEQLLAHMTVQHRGFAASVRGAGRDLRLWDPATVSDPRDDYAAAAHDVLDAFGAEGVADTMCALPEFGPDAAVPGSVAMAMHFVDYLVHGWDVAAGLGRNYRPSDESVTAALPIVLGIPDDETRTAPEAPFGPAHHGSAATDFDRILAHLGRRPDWAQQNSTVTGA
ncbi:TIGR03086 family metal-binding protein [Mycobacterium sp. NPDC003323]